MRLRRLEPPEGRIPMVLDTDTYNEIDDQFAVVHALLSRKELDLQALYAAPFHNARSSGPRDGMEKSYQEMMRLLERLDMRDVVPVFKGAGEYLTGRQEVEENPAVSDLIDRARNADGPLYVAAIGAITNIAIALKLAPDLVDRIVIIWLGGQPLHWPTAEEFNLRQDREASQLVLDCGVPLVLIPCSGVASHLQTTLSEVNTYLRGQNAIGDYLAAIFEDYHDDHYARSKVIWDVSATGYLIHPGWVGTELVHSPILTGDMTWSTDRRRHLIRVASRVNRDAIFGDLFRKVAGKE